MSVKDQFQWQPLLSLGRRIGRAIILTFAILFAIQLGTAVLGIPRWLTSWLYCADHASLNIQALYQNLQPHYVVLLGDRIPSGEGLMRAYYTGEFGRNRHGIEYIISMPASDSPEIRDPGRIRDELIRRGIDQSNIIFESRGRDTREQALRVRDLVVKNGLSSPILIVTSPTHARRALLCFKKVGFKQVSVMSAFDTGDAVDLGPSIFLRYTLWGTLSLQPELARELIAIAFYWLHGWV